MSKKIKEGSRKVERDDRTIKEMFTSRAFRAGGYSVLISLVAIAVVVIINLIVSNVPANLTKFDMTPNSILTLEDQTEQILATLGEDVTIYMICSEGNEDSYTLSLLEQYAAKSGHIKIATKDPVLYPNFVTQYTSGTVNKNSLVVLSDKRGKYVDYNDIYITTKDKDGNTTDVSFDGEGAITSAIDYVVSDSLPIVYALTGHGEQEIPATIQDMIRQDNMELRTINLMTLGAVPEDADCVFLAAPTTDISEAEEEALRAYMEQGGNLLLITGLTTQSTLPNLLKLTDYYGMNLFEGAVLEGNGDNYYSSSALGDTAQFYIVPNLEDVEINAALRAANYRVIMPLSMPIIETDLHRSSVEITPILTTSAQAYAKHNFDTRGTNEKTDGDLEGPFSVGVLMTEQYADVTSNMVWFTSSALLDESINNATSGANADLIMASLGYMTGDVNSISIHNSSTLFYDYLVVTKSDSVMWTILFAALIPVMLLVAGGVILYRRRKH